MKDRLDVSLDTPLTIQDLAEAYDAKGGREDLKKEICERTISILRAGGRLNIIHSYLEKVQGMNDKIPENRVPGVQEIKQDLVVGLNKLSSFNGDDLVSTPALSDVELKTLYLTPPKAKLDQIKKDDWLAGFADSDNKKILTWLTETISEDKSPPETPHISVVSEGGDEDAWKDLSIIYSDAIDSMKEAEKKSGVTELTKNLPNNIPITGISINVGKVETYKKWFSKFIGSLEDLAKGTVTTLFNLITTSSIIALKVSGTFVKISSEFVATLLINIIKDKTNVKFRKLVENIISGVMGAPFIISDNHKEIRKKIIHKYKLFLTCIVIKIIFMLGTIDYVVDDEQNLFGNIRSILNTGIERLNLYNRGLINKSLPNIKIKVKEIMDTMNKYTEWYLLRKTATMIIADTQSLKSDTVIIIDDKKPLSQMTVEDIAKEQGFGPFGSEQSVPGNDPMDMDTDPSASKKKKNTKKRKRKSNTKKRKRKSNTKKRKKIKKKTKQKKKK